MNPYYQGDLANVTTGPGFLDENGDPVDPTTLTLTVGIQGSGAAIVTYTYGVGSVIVKDSTGNYEADIDTTMFVPGVYWYKWVGTGTAQAVNEGAFLVLPVNV